MTNNLMVKEIVTEVLKRVETYFQKEKPILLVIHENTEKNILQIKQLKKDWDVVEHLSANMDVPSIHQAVFLDVNQDLFVKGAVGIADTNESILLAKLLLAGVKVFLVPDESLSNILNLDKDKHPNKSYVSMLQEYENQLQRFGVVLQLLSTIVPENSKPINEPVCHEQGTFSDKLLTKQVVETWRSKQINIKPNTIITPLARDIARERGIKISTNDAKGGEDTC
ncbi:hypothetical protein [Alkalihalobacterium elongatum]|uniref:hypothetical protein n=1 Tax=Alkalihalobacterium elongatum TaxID=2675466 RepID=UPI001C1F8200|nr:hypothetical protein [Alkalihalobacterium elongatum]